ncbi:amidohydrolase family protein [Sporichthya sp.]|uniref:amidohydrolase family protein n=1 Tax=Sporichthya sp. TaxID=65475 RepID=UPI0017DF50DB|nr:amidohydrolase family protein [Sporichthya sp.]MBA3741961.1 amidohydrolase [Sporichthya sp.]
MATSTRTTVGRTQTVASRAGNTTVTFLPEPEKRHRYYTVVSADDHLVEPPGMFDGRAPQAYADRVPRIEEFDGGAQAWVYDGNVLPTVGLAAVVGRPVTEYSAEPTRFEHMRRGAWDPVARLADMDLDGIYASVNFPSHLAGFGGGRLQTIVKDPDLAFATVRAWNDWNLEEWAGGSNGRLVPCQLPFLLDPVKGAAEIRANAERGVRLVTFPESPDDLGLPSIFTDHWDPIFAACEETGTVVNLHIGSGGALPPTRDGAPADVVAVLFGMYAMHTAVDWVYSMVPLRFPNLKICLAEGGIGWVAGLLDRLEHTHRMHRDMYGTWPAGATAPADVARSSFWYCMLEDPSSVSQRHLIGIDHIMVEVDYPHADSTWPNSQEHLHHHLKDLPADEVEAMTWRTASTLFGVDVPAAVVADPNSF